MSQSDFDLANQSRSLFRADNNAALQALAGCSSGATEPATTYAYQLWADTSSGILKQRNAANSAWINLFTLADGNLAQLGGATFTGPVNEARGTVTMHATTMDLWAQPNTIDGTGSAVTITAIANAPQAGAKRTLYPITGTVITNGATFAVDGAADYTTAAGDALEFEAVTTSTYKVHIIKKDGTAVVGSATSISKLNTSIAVTDTGTDGKITKTVDGVVISEETGAARKSTIDGGATLYPEFKCRAWGNFVGSTGALNAGGNASITRNSAGSYAVTFITALPDENYSVVVNGFASAGEDAGSTGSVVAINYTNTGFTIDCESGNATPTQADPIKVSFAVFR